MEICSLVAGGDSLLLSDPISKMLHFFSMGSVLFLFYYNLLYFISSMLFYDQVVNPNYFEAAIADCLD
jgi:hypothetical protein